MEKTQHAHPMLCSTRPSRWLKEMRMCHFCQAMLLPWMENDGPSGCTTCSGFRPANACTSLRKRVDAPGMRRAEDQSYVAVHAQQNSMVTEGDARAAATVRSQQSCAIEEKKSCQGLSGASSQYGPAVCRDP